MGMKYRFRRFAKSAQVIIDGLIATLFANVKDAADSLHNVGNVVKDQDDTQYLVNADVKDESDTLFTIFS